MHSISIIIINHNYGEFLRGAIESALAQELSAQVVVVDDGSTDGSVEIINEYGMRIVPVIKARGGHVSSVNAGYRASTGDLCVFLDADDILYSNCVSEAVRTWSEGDVKFQFRLDTINRDGVNQDMPFPHFAPDLTPEAILEQSRRSGWYPWTVSSGNVFARKFLEQIMPIDAERIYRSPDGYLSKLAPLFGAVRSSMSVLGAYRVHGANAWAQAAGEWSPATAIRWLKFNQALEVAFLEAAARQNVAVSEPLEPSFQQLEYRLAAMRFAPSETPYVGDNRLNLFRLFSLGVMRAQNVNLIGRLLWLAWFSTLAIGPKGMVKAILVKARGQSGRSQIARSLIALARGRASRKRRAAQNIQTIDV